MFASRVVGRCRPVRRSAPSGIRFPACQLATALVFVLFAAWLAPPVVGQTQPAAGPQPLLRTADLLALEELVRTQGETKDPYELMVKAAFGNTQFGADEIVAYEQHRLFLYAAGEAAKAFAPAAGGTPEKAPRWARRLFMLGSSTFVVEDEVRLLVPPKPLELLLDAGGKAEVSDRQVRTLAKVAWGQADAAGMATHHLVHVFQVHPRGDEKSAASAEVKRTAERWELTIHTPQQIVRLWLPPWSAGSGEIAVEGADGKALLERRLLSAGLLPRGPEGMRLLERWDSSYRGGRPGWDTGRPSSELVKAVEEGTLKPCRVVELGCGTGTNAIYLAGKGFDVSAVDIAPTALRLAEQKAQKAKVRVRWLLADVLAPPKIEPFDLIYDRGCYHGVRRQNAAGYVTAIKKLSKPGTRVLILAGNANEKQQYGPPRVKEEELRTDFSAAFEFEWLRETRFDTTDPARQGALAWSILLRRKNQ